MEKISRNQEKQSPNLNNRKTQQEMNDNFPCLAAVIDKIEEEEPNRLDAVCEKVIETERIDYLE